MADMYDDPRGAKYVYGDGRVVHRSPTKMFTQSGNTRGTPQLYRTEKVRAAVAVGTTVYLVEGEKDVHALESLGAVATTAPMGATNFSKADVSPLKGATLVVVPDRDRAGEKWLADVREAVEGLARTTVQVREPATGKDAADHVAAGHGLEDLIPVRISPSLDIVTASDVEVSRVVYTWEARIPRGAMTLMPGEEGIGKTTVGIRLIADLTQGTLPGEHYGTPCDVLVLAAEDGLADVFVPRLREAGAELARVHIVRATISLDDARHDVIVPRDLPTIGEAVRRLGIAMVWIDSLVTTLPDELKSISYKDTAKVLRRLGSWAEAERVAVVAPWHLNKASGNETAIRIMDSRAFRTAVRSMLLVVADPEAPEGGPPQGLVALDKANAGTLNVPALRYRIRRVEYDVTEVDEKTGEIREAPASCGVVDWIGEVDGGLALARSFLAPAMSRGEDPRIWLRDYLTEHGLTLRQVVIEAGAGGGFSEKKLQRAASSLGVVYVDMTLQREGTTPLARKGWRLPSGEEDGGQDSGSLTVPSVLDVLTVSPGRDHLSSPSQVSDGEDGQDGQDGQVRVGESVLTAVLTDQQSPRDLPTLVDLLVGDRPGTAVRCPTCFVQATCYGPSPDTCSTCDSPLAQDGAA